MSLIEEALRKQREEAEQANPIEATPPPADQGTPPPLPEETAENPGSHRPWPILAGLAAAGVAAVLLICALLYFGLKLWYQKPEPSVAKGNPTTVAPVKTPVATPAVATIPSTPSPATHAAQPAKEIPVAVKPETQRVVTATAPAVPAPSVPASTATPPKPSVEKPATPIAAAPAPAPVATPATPAAALPPAIAEKVAMPVIWPRLSVSGIIGNSKTKQSAAIINGQFVGPGDNVEGVKVSAVDRQRVTLIFNGETRILSAGTTTE